MNIHDWDNMTDDQKHAELDKIETQKKARFKSGKKYHITHREQSELVKDISMRMFGKAIHARVRASRIGKH